MMKTVVIFTILVSSIILNATDIKGRISGSNNITKEPYALKDIDIRLYQERSGEWIKVGKFITNSNGMYYFKNLESGRYTIQVNGKANYPIEVLNQDSQELAPIIINYK